MKIRSRGLGKRELHVDLHEFSIEQVGYEVVLSGVTHAPVTWETNIRFQAEDIGGLIRVALSPKILKLALRWALRMKTPKTQNEEVSWERKRTSTKLHRINDEDQTALEVSVDKH